MCVDFLVISVLSLLAFLLAAFFTLVSLALAILALALLAFDWVLLVVVCLSSRKSMAPGDRSTLLFLAKN